MFKRPKGVSDSNPAPAATTTSQADNNTSEKPAGSGHNEANQDAAGTRIVTPSYQARKSPVRTLQSTSISPSAPAQSANANLHVGRGLKLEGKIQSCDSLVIEGDVQATIESGTLTITETGDVRGDATVDEAEVNGKFDGTLTVRRCLTINSSGRVTGTVRYGELKVEQGGQVTGEIRASDDKTPVPPAKNDDKSKTENGAARPAAMI